MAKVECASRQRLPSGVVSRGDASGNNKKGGGGTKSDDPVETRARPDQSLPKGFNSGGQGAYQPSHPLTTRDYHGTRANTNQKLPGDHWDGTNVSQGKSVGATRSADAYQGPRHEQDDPTPRKPGQ